MESKILNLLLTTPDFKGHTVLKWNVVESKTAFGFMSSIFEARLATVNGKMKHQFQLIIKKMKGNEDFRQKSLSYLQFRNEIYFYEKIVPYFDAFLIHKNVDFHLTRWLPKTFLCIYGHEHANDSLPESILVQENIQENGFLLEPSLYLTEEFINIMIECLAQFHAISIASKIENEDKFLSIVDGIKPLCFEQPDGCPRMYDILHEISTTRLFDCVFKQDNQFTKQFIRDINRLKEVVGEKPVKLLDRFRQIDRFAVIGHGDYHRNNILFKRINNCVIDMKMIDFQQLRYGSPCLDLSFFMYLNISAELRESLWSRILLVYHQQFIKHIAEILRIPQNDSVLMDYSYEQFLKHCQRFFLYGALISVSFTPWLLTTDSETEKIAHLFEENMFDPEYRKFALLVGGEEANARVVGNMIHASEMGYMKMLYD